MSLYHVPVLQEESISLLNIKKDGIYIDCTLGGGGHFLEMLKRLGDTGFLIGLDQDKRMIDTLNEKLKSRKNIALIHDNFRNIKRLQGARIRKS